MSEFAYMVGVKVLANLLCIGAIVGFFALLWLVDWAVESLRHRKPQPRA